MPCIPKHFLCNSKFFKLYIINSFQLFLGMPRPLLHFGSANLSHLLTRSSILILFIWANHLSLVLVILSSVEFTHILSPISTSDLIQSRLSAHPTKYRHLSDHHPFGLRLFNWPTLYVIQ